MKSIIVLIFTSLFLIQCRSLVQVPPPPLKSPLKKTIITQKFSPFWNPSHRGIDFKANRGTPIFSSHSGRVVYAGKRLSGFGNTVIVEYSKHWSTLYAHLDSIKVQEGQKVSQGDVLGTAGNTGRSSGVHLHFELIYNKQSVNPMPYLGL